MKNTCQIWAPKHLAKQQLRSTAQLWDTSTWLNKMWKVTGRTWRCFGTSFQCTANRKPREQMRKFVTRDRTVSLQNPVGDHAQNKKHLTTLARGEVWRPFTCWTPWTSTPRNKPKISTEKAEIENPGSVGHWHRSCGRKKGLWS